MKNKQTMLIISLIAIIALAMVACNEPNPPPPPDTTPPETTPPNTTPPTVTITNANQTKTLAPDLVIELSATVTQGTNPIQSKEWTLKNPVDGVTPVFADKTALTTTVTGIKKAGTFVFELKVKDTTDKEGTATATVVVNGYQVTTTLTIASNSFSSIPGTNLDFTPSYTNVSNPTDFTTAVINSCLTYTITVVNHNGSYTHTWNSTDSNFDGKILPINEYGTDLAIFTQTFYNNGQVKGIPRVVKAMVEANKFQYFGDTYTGTGSIPAITGITISKTITEILPPPITKTVTVSFPAFTAGSTTLSFAPTYDPSIAGGGFENGDVTYTLTDDKGNSWTTGYIVDATTASGYGQPDTITFTQVYKMNGVEIATRSLRAMIPPTGGKRFLSIQDMNGGSLSNIPPITLTLSKPGTW